MEHVSYNLRLLGKWKGCLQWCQFCRQDSEMRVWELQDWSTKICFHRHKDAIFLRIGKDNIIYYEFDNGRKKVIELDDFNWSQRLLPLSPCLVNLFKVKQAWKKPLQRSNWKSKYDRTVAIWINFDEGAFEYPCYHLSIAHIKLKFVIASNFLMHCPSIKEFSGCLVCFLCYAFFYAYYVKDFFFQNISLKLPCGLVLLSNAWYIYMIPLRFFRQ